MLKGNLAVQGEIVTQSRAMVPEVYYREEKVITTETLAIGYGASTQQIINNFNRNKSRFEEGRHYYIVEGKELKAMKNHNSLRGMVNKHASQLTLWTERGASRHAKMLETDQAWDYFELLEETYFSSRKGLVTPGNYLEALESLVKAEKEKIAIAAERDHAIKTKAWIGEKREATAMATASAEKRKANALAEKLGESKKRATVLAVEKMLNAKFPWYPLKKWCKDNKAEIQVVHDDRYGSANSYPAKAWMDVYRIDLKKVF